VDALTVDRTRTIRLGGGMGGMGGGMGAFTIDGRTFDMGRIDIEAAIDTIEEWTIVNDSMMAHPFHLHVWPMRVVGDGDGAADSTWRDTVNVAAGSSVTVRIPFHDFTGTAVYHCHILDHEDMGMMGVIRVG
jgi:FtsP/CotA-like multicopper oxidase with cupredoxin domain